MHIYVVAQRVKQRAIERSEAATMCWNALEKLWQMAVNEHPNA